MMEKLLENFEPKRDFSYNVDEEVPDEEVEFLTEENIWTEFASAIMGEVDTTKEYLYALAGEFSDEDERNYIKMRKPQENPLEMV
jgi:hypothetical protein